MTQKRATRQRTLNGERPAQAAEKFGGPREGRRFLLRMQRTFLHELLLLRVSLQGEIQTSPAGEWGEGREGGGCVWGGGGEEEGARGSRREKTV